MKEPKFEIKPPEEKPAAEGEPEIETWEGEGGTVEEPEEEQQEVFDKSK